MKDIDLMEIEVWQGCWVNFSRSSTVSVMFFNIEISITVSIDELPAWCMFSLATFEFGHFSSMWLEAVLWLVNSLNLTCESELWPSLVNLDLRIEECPGIYSVLFVFYWKIDKWHKMEAILNRYIYICMSFKQHLLINKDRMKEKSSHYCSPSNF